MKRIDKKHKDRQKSMRLKMINTMAVIIAAACIGAALFSVADAQAYTYINDTTNPSSEADLYTIVNSIFNTSYISSDELFIEIGLSDEEDNRWEEIDSGYVNVTVRYAGYGQELGIEDANGIYYRLASGIPSGMNAIYVNITVETDFVFVEKLSGSGSGVGPWYSDDRNALGVDHFVALEVTDLFNITFSADVSRAWVIAFEDLANGGDHDYNDLVAVVANVEPTLVTLSSLAARPLNSGARIVWETESEIDNAGFNIYRAETPGGKYTQINKELIPAAGSPVEGGSYAFEDRGLKNKKTYYYRLEDIDMYGNSTFHGPVEATPRLVYGMFDKVDK